MRSSDIHQYLKLQESISQVAKKRRAKHHHFCFDIILQVSLSHRYKAPVFSKENPLFFSMLLCKSSAAAAAADYNVNMALCILSQWVSMAECITEYRVEMGINLPINEWREWKTLFIKGAILPAELPVEPLPEEPPAEKEVRLAKVLCFPLYP